MNKHLGINCCLKNRPFAFKIAANQRSIRKVAVVGKGKGSTCVVDAQRLRVCSKTEARRRIANVSNGDFSMIEMRQLLTEYLADQTHALFDIDPIAIRECNTRALLSAVLERKETKIRHFGHVLHRGVHTVDAAFFLPLWHFFVHLSYASPVSLWSISL